MSGWLSSAQRNQYPDYYQHSGSVSHPMKYYLSLSLTHRVSSLNLYPWGRKAWSIPGLDYFRFLLPIVKKPEKLRFENKIIDWKWIPTKDQRLSCGSRLKGINLPSSTCSDWIYKLRKHLFATYSYTSLGQWNICFPIEFTFRINLLCTSLFVQLWADKFILWI